MKEIGKQLKEERVKRKLSYAQVASLTKLNEQKIKALEEGDLDFFIDELSFVKFYLRSYCKALQIPYEDHRSQFEEHMVAFTTSLDMIKMAEREELEQNIIKSSKDLRKPERKDRTSISQQMKNTKRGMKKIDLPLVSLIAIVCIVVGIIVVVGFGALFGGQKEETPKQEETTQVQPTPEKEEETEKEVEETPVEATIAFSETDATNYVMQIKGQEETNLEISFAADCYVEILLNGVRVDNPNNFLVLNTTQPFTQTLNLQTNDVLTFKLGNFAAAKPVIKINGVELVYNYEQLQTQGSVVSFALQTIRGE